MPATSGYTITSEMAFLSKFIGFYGESKGDDSDEVRPVKLASYQKSEIDRRHNDVMLYVLASTQDIKEKEDKKDKEDNKENSDKVDKKDEIGKTPPRYDLVLHKHSTYKDLALSVLRFTDVKEAREAFELLKDKLPLFVGAFGEYAPPKDVVRTFVAACRSHPTWHVCHVAAHMGNIEVLKHESMKTYLDEVTSDTAETPLHVALNSQQVAAVHCLMQLGVKVGPQDHNKQDTAFHAAVRTRRKSLVEALCKAPRIQLSAINRPNKEGHTPLQLACLSGSMECVQLLFRYGADVNSANFSRLKQKPKDPKPKTYALSPDSDVSVYNQELVKLGGTPLHWAQKLTTLKALIEKGCDVNATNSEGKTALHIMASLRKLNAVITLLIEGAKVDVNDDDGNTALHLAFGHPPPPKPLDLRNLFKKVSDRLPVAQALLAFGANMDAVNKKGETPRHLAARERGEKSDVLVYTLHAIGARRCTEKLEDCTPGCSPVGDFDGTPPENFLIEGAKIMDSLLDMQAFTKALQNCHKPRTGRRCRALSLDGGGVKGLVVLRTLKSLEGLTGKPILSCFDWVIGTSAGGICALSLASGYTVDEAMRSAYKLKEKFVVGVRPYDTTGMELFLKNQLGEKRISDIKTPRMAITAVNAESVPTRLKLFRNYLAPREMLKGDRSPPKMDNQYLWSIARATAAAPTLFDPYENYLDGAIIANNPTMDLLTDITEHNAAVKMKGLDKEAYEVDIVISIGAGERPKAPVSTLETLHYSPGLLGLVKGMACSGVSLAKMCVEQIAEPDGRHVDRIRAWCHGIGVPYARIRPVLSQHVVINETDNKVLVKVLWEAMAYFYHRRDELQQIAQLLRD